jgi:hypothetical protein
MCECPECRELADEIRANAEALRALRDEPLPGRPSKQIVWPAVAVAAAVLIAAALPALRQKTAAQEPPAVAQPLTIKLLTPDPNVVIYWLIDSKENTSQ